MRPGLTARQGETTTLVVPVPEKDGVVDNWRMQCDWSARAGVPSHITLLGPFLPPDRVGSRVVERLRSLFGSCQPVKFNLASVERLSGLVYLSPEPVAPFRLLTEMLEREWPEAPRFGSGYDRPLYHLTVARDARDFDEIREGLGGHLPIGAIAREVLLLEKRPKRSQWSRPTLSRGHGCRDPGRRPGVAVWIARASRDHWKE